VLLRCDFFSRSVGVDWCFHLQEVDAAEVIVHASCRLQRQRYLSALQVSIH